MQTIAQENTLENVILTTYFTSRKDPQRHSYHKPNDPKKLVLLEGANKLGLKVIVFHDQLSDEFVEKHTTEHVQFSKDVIKADLSCNDSRFFTYQTHLEVEAYKNVWLSDMFDVHVKKDPNDLINDKYKLWIGTHNKWVCNGRSVPDENFVEWKLRKCYRGILPVECSGMPILMAGTWGGPHKHIMEALDFLTREIWKCKALYNCNLPCFNRAMYKFIGKEHLWLEGFPLVSEFRQNQINADVCFVHK